MLSRFLLSTLVYIVPLHGKLIVDDVVVDVHVDVVVFVVVAVLKYTHQQIGKYICSNRVSIRQSVFHL